MLIYHRENVLILCIGGNRALEIEIQTLKWSSYFDEVSLLLWFEVVWLNFSTIPTGLGDALDVLHREGKIA